MEKSVISPGNLKLGACPNVSLLPGKTCPKNCPCIGRCYAKKALRRPCVFNKWSANTSLWEGDPKEFERQIMVYLEKHPSSYFRWQVAGDIPDVNYLRMMLRVARRFPDTKFLCFTKKYELLVREEPDALPNLSLVVSGWNGWKEALLVELTKQYPASWVVLKDGHQRWTLWGEGAFLCPGKCGPCGYKCWSLKAGQCVEFKEH